MLGPWAFALAVVLFALLVFLIARHDKTSSLHFGVFLEHRREERERQPEPWPGEETRIDHAGQETLVKWPKEGKE